jgi:hypothetical protein
MQLKWFHVKEFQSVQDSGRVDVAEIACLVGKNEAGKTALLRALYRLSPIVEAEGKFDVTHDYPRVEVEDYRHAVEAGECEVAVPIKAGFLLDAKELAEVEGLFGPQCLGGDPELTVSKNYDDKCFFELSADQPKALAHLVDKAGFSQPIREAIKSIPRTVNDLLTALQGQEQTEEVKRVTEILKVIETRGVNGYIYDKILAPNEPKFLYFDEYYQNDGAREY